MMDIKKKTEAFRKVNDNPKFRDGSDDKRNERRRKELSDRMRGRNFLFTNKGGDAVKYEIDETGGRDT